MGYEKCREKKSERSRDDVLEQYGRSDMNGCRVTNEEVRRRIRI